MSIIFSSSIVFTPILFYCRYGEKLTKWDCAGAMLIAACVVMIGIGGVNQNS